MQWFRNNVLGLVALALTFGGGYIALFSKITDNAKTGSVIYAKLEAFNSNSQRLTTTLDKLDVLYHDVKVVNSVQSEQIAQLKYSLEKLEK